MIILGIDPSSTSTGYGLIEYRQRKYHYVKCGCIRPPATLAFEDRLVFIYDRLGEIIAGAAPDQVAIESTFFGKDAHAAARLGEARGVLLLAVKKACLPIAHYTPAEVKKAIAGRGRATKEQVQFMVARLLDLKEVPRPLDASDALAIALCHLHQPDFNSHQVGRRRKPEIEALLRRAKRR